MQKGTLHILFRKSVCCLVFLFSFFFSYSAIYNDKHVYVQVENETSIDPEQLDYSEFALTSNGHSTESPENPAEGETNSEVEKEKENETDDNKDEIIENCFSDALIIHEICKQEKTRLVSELDSRGEFVPFYILFHSWKSFLV